MQNLVALGFFCLFVFVLFIFFLFVVNFVIHWNKTVMGLHVFPIPIPPPTSLFCLFLYIFYFILFFALVLYIIQSHGCLVSKSRADQIEVIG